ncbi:transcriptional regulator [Ruminiclostridium cellulolyticum]|uniref:Transcription activator effector binding n=1 Tax=Ruminiclostridium cellulolyticum (strain ATCC 35319 / DSM 5812 / JCM 6584 / H10) TaxID=394503 RepID=B8HZV9_RUMCH|nr:transcriptional regulator [Ruminiclostridium cellulolyticum]ACL75459.1 hypothetical protein Ccel_1100 [Ruminiclostridium cellulolyticum H10]
MIESGKEFIMENVLSLRKKMTQKELDNQLEKIGEFLQNNGATQAGPIVTVTFGIETKEREPLLDMEILVPMDKELELSGDYVFKPLFRITNAVYARHKGNPADLQRTYNEMILFIQENNLQQITVGYNVLINEPMPGLTLDDMIIDVYIGINPNIL